MNSEELFNELKKFNESNYNVILIDGPWGSGKTYLINRYLKYANKINIKVYYVSMLGKKNVDDINTSLYSEIHKDEKINSLVPSALNALDNKENNLDFVLKISNTKRKENTIVILDDLERYASTDYDEFLAYISNLVLKGAKIICVSNLGELGGGELYNFNLYKEKIFDRVYEAELFNKNVINEKMHEFSPYLDNTLINLFNKNFRIVDKTYNFLNDLNKVFKKEKIELNYFDKKALIFYSITLLNVYYDNKKLTLENFKIRPSNEVLAFNKLSFNNDTDNWSSVFIYEYAINTNYIYRYENDYIFIKSLLKAYIFTKYDELINFYKHKEFSAFDLTNAKEITLDLLYSLTKLVNVKTYNKLFDALYEKITNIDTINKFLSIYKDDLNEIEYKFYNELLTKYHNEKEANLMDNLLKYFIDKDFDKMFDLINNNLDLFSGDIDKNLEEFLIKNNFLIEINNIKDVYLINYVHILNNSSLHNALLKYLESLTKNDLVNKLISILTYIAEGISE